jgi:peptidoglycan/xylan/chitin deacetylase (PgdA/CDA1 family)
VLWRERLLGVAAALLPTREDPSSPQAWDRGAVVILYHRVTDGAARTADPFAVDRRAFERQVEWLSRTYTLVTVGELVRRLREGRPLAGTAAITFDDGYECTVGRAWPILRSFKAPATLFLDTGRLDGPRPALSHAEVRAMAAEGMEIGSHSVSHPDLTTLDDAALREELVRSRESLSALTGGPIRGFAHPFGRYDERVVRRVREAGYEYACTCRQHRANHPDIDPYRLNRVEINQGDGHRRFEGKVKGRYAGVYAAWYRLNPATRAWLADER